MSEPAKNDLLQPAEAGTGQSLLLSSGGPTVTPGCEWSLWAEQFQRAVDIKHWMEPL